MLNLMFILTFFTSNFSFFFVHKVYGKVKMFLWEGQIFWKISHFYSVTSKQVGGFFKFLWPFQKTWTLSWNSLFFQCGWRLLLCSTPGRIRQWFGTGPRRSNAAIRLSVSFFNFWWPLILVAYFLGENSHGCCLGFWSL